MNPKIHRALEKDLTIDITTKGRESGQLRKIEIWFHNIDGIIYITGAPGPRDWYANMLSEPKFTFHLKESVHADIPARAKPIVDPTEREGIFTRMKEKITIGAFIQGDWNLGEWVDSAPLVEVVLRDNQCV